MQLSAAMDAGPVYAFESHPLTGAETQPELYETLSQVGASLLVKSLPHILSEALQPTSQDDSAATYCSIITKQDGHIDTAKPAHRLEREVRAYKGWPGSRTTLGDIDATITAAHVSSTPEDLSIQCGDGAHLTIDTLKPAGKKEMPVQAFLTGYKDRL